MFTFRHSVAATAGVVFALLASAATAQWTETTLGPGVVWKSQVYTSLYGGKQTVNVIQVDLNNPNIRIEPIKPSSGCSTTSGMANAFGALAAINGGFFDGSCNSVSMLKIAGTVTADNPSYKPPRATLGLKKNIANYTPYVDWIGAGDSWSAVDHALGGGPNLVSSGSSDVTLTGEDFDSSYASKNPRTAVGFTSSNQLLMVTVDGRTSAGVGMTLSELASYMINLGCNEAMNLDGGGSTTAWTSANGVVNTPSDGSQRSVASALAVWSNGFTVDNLSSPGYTEVGANWLSSSNSGYYNADSRYNVGGTGSETATWAPNLPVAGRYDVYAWWVASSNRPTNAQYLVNHLGGTATLSANQTTNGGQWNLLGEYSFNLGTGGTVTLTDSAASTKVVSADAVRLIYKGTLPDVIQDNTGANFIKSANWAASTSSPGYYGGDYHVRATASVSDAATWRATLPVTGNYKVYARWTTHANRATAAPFVVEHTGGSTTVNMNQTQNNGTWVLLGTFNMASGTLDRVRLSCWTGSGSYVVADAIKLEAQ